MRDGHDTGIELLTEAAETLELASAACESAEDAEHLTSLAERLRGYLAVSRPTTTLGMPRIPSSPNKLVVPERMRRQDDQPGQTHVRVLPN